MADEQYPGFEGASHTPENKAHIWARKVLYRKQLQLHRASYKAKVVAINRLTAVKLASLTWLPFPIAEIRPVEIGLVFQK
jgi:hypothetical protein